jgi:hypothetical protein
MKGLITIATLLAFAAIAYGDPDVPDLRVKAMPPKLKMRPKVPKKPKSVAQQPAPAEGEEGEAEGEEGEAEGEEKPAAAPAPAKDDTSGVSASFKPIPTSARDLKERVIFKINAGVQLDSAPANGEFQRGGLALPDGFADNRAWILGDAVVAAHDIILPSMGGYFLTGFAFDATNSLETRTATISPYDQEALAIKAGYAEWGRDDRKPNASGPWLRGGRQFRHDGGALFAYFDGATAGYRTAKGIEASVFGGQRVALYVTTPKGIEYGATASVDLKKMSDIPVRIAADFMGLNYTPLIPDPNAIDTGAELGDSVLIDGDAQNRLLVVLTGSADVTSKGKLDLRARMVDAGQGDGFALGRAGARLRYNLSPALLFLGDVERRQGTDLAYDLAAVSAVDVVNIAEQLGVGLNAPVDATRIGARLDWRKKETELLAFAATEQASGTPVATDQRGWIEGGVGIAGTPVGSRGAGLWATAQYTYRNYLNGGHDNDQMGSEFGDSSTSGVDQMHEMAVDATLRSSGQKMSQRKWRASGGVFYRIYDFSSPYRDVKQEGRGGGRADLSFWFSRDLRLLLAGEAAQASAVLAREIGIMISARAAMEARW